MWQNWIVMYCKFNVSRVFLLLFDKIIDLSSVISTLSVKTFWTFDIILQIFYKSNLTLFSVIQKRKTKPTGSIGMYWVGLTWKLTLRDPSHTSTFTTSFYATHPTPSTWWEMSLINSFATLSPTTPSLLILGIYQSSYIPDFWKIPDVACITHHLSTACWLKVVKNFFSENFWFSIDIFKTK